MGVLKVPHIIFLSVESVATDFYYGPSKSDVPSLEDRFVISLA